MLGSFDSWAGSEKIDWLMTRRSVPPRLLGWPGPSDAQLKSIARVGLRAPDNGGLKPWRVIHIPFEQREHLARWLPPKKHRRYSQPATEGAAHAQDHAMSTPTLLAFVVCVRTNARVPVHEQWLAAGAALANMLNAFHALGFGANMLSGEPCGNSRLAAALGVRRKEQLAGFISAGTVSKALPSSPGTSLDRVWSTWRGC